MGLRVIGAGVGRTGTHSLKVALEPLLGGRCHHMVEMFGNEEQIAGWTAAIDSRPVDWSHLLRDYVAVVDWPGASLWPELTGAFPDALVLLSTRDPDAWYRSASDTIFTAIDPGNPWFAAVLRLFSERFSADFHDKDAMIAAFERHNDAVRAAVPSDRLLEWQPADGWAPICDRLGVPTPAEPFPVTNTTEEFRAMLASRLAGQSGNGSLTS